MTTGSARGGGLLGLIGAIWGVAGLSLVLGRGLFSLMPYVAELPESSFSRLHWAALAASLLFMDYAEGYKGFHLKFSPRAAARALYLRNNPTVVRVVFAPFFCIGFFHATRKRKIVAYSLTTMIILLIVSVRSLPQPWRGIVDAGVLLGLGWGLVSVWIFAAKAFFGKNYAVSPETPEA
ncbi:hypothetical protein [Pontiella sp.]|uniref:hypothetical protein n=1 Tax=Pontiella sp. TaxID=2837462 RepID=UPI003561C46B